jgi:hypothetical protein
MVTSKTTKQKMVMFLGDGGFMALVYPAKVRSFDVKKE